MNTRADKTPENKRQSVGNPVIQKQSTTESLLQFRDNRSTAAIQQKLQETANNSPQAKQSAQLEAMADHHSARQSPIQQDLKTQMGNQHGVDLSDYKEHPNSSFPASVDAVAAIQEKDIHYAQGQFTEKNRKHELGHAIDNALNGTPEGDKIVNGHLIDTTREKVAEKIANTPLQRKTLPPSIAPQKSNSVVQRVKIHGVNKNKAMNIPKLTAKLEKKAKQWAEAQKLDWKDVEYFFSAYGSIDDEFASEEAFFHALHYDVTYMSGKDQPHTIQEAWTTSRGWDARAKGTSKADILKGDVRLYRTMGLAEFKAIQGDDTKALSGHLGDFKEALNYLYGKSADDKVLVEFVISGQNMQNLYKNVAFPKQKSASLLNIESAMKKESKGFAAKAGASKDQGYAKDGSIGLKAEKHGDAQFSLGIGKSAKPAMAFLKLVSSFRVLASSDGRTVTWGSKLPQGSPGKGSAKSGKAEHRSYPGVLGLANALGLYLNQAEPRVIDEIGQKAAPEDVAVMLNEPVSSKKSSKSSKGKGPNVNEGNFNILENPGGGDCLFFALNRSNDQEAADQTRHQVVMHLSEQGDLSQNMVDALLPDMLHRSPHPELRALEEDSQDLQNIPRQAYYRLMGFQGTWAGRTEIAAYAIIRNISVFVVESIGRITHYQAGGGVQDNLDALPQDVFAGNSIVLYKTPNHWRRVLGFR